MRSSLPNLPLLLSLLFILPLIACSSTATKVPTKIKFQKGPILTRNINLSILWYGNFSLNHKTTVANFIESLNNERNVSFVPRVSTWWDKVESYQVFASKGVKKGGDIEVKVVGQVDDDKYSVGKELSGGLIEGLVKKVVAGKPPGTVAVVFAGADVKVEDACSRDCYFRGVFGNQLYVVVNNPIKECPKKCAWPFTTSSIGGGAPGLTVLPPNQGEGSDAMIVHFASALAATVTNPYRTGFYGDVIEAATACMGVFGSGSFPGYTGRIRICPQSGTGFNAHGVNSSKFLLPAVWDPKTSSCWTTL